MGLVKGCPSLQAAGTTCNRLVPESMIGTAEAPKPLGPCSGPEHQPCVGLQIITVQPAKAHTWLTALSSLSLGCGHFAGRPGCSVPLFQHLGDHCPCIGPRPAPAVSMGIVMLPSQPCSPSTASTGQMLGQDRANGPFARMWDGRSHRSLVHGAGGRARTDTSLPVDRASTQQEQLPHCGRSERLLVGYFFNIF